MKHAILPFFAVLCSITAILSQDHFEANGQTSVFTLKAGEKSIVSAVTIPVLKQMKNGISVQYKSNTLFVNFLDKNSTRSAEISIYNIQGRTVKRVQIFANHVYQKNMSDLATGVYNVIVKTDGILYNYRFLVSK